MPRLLWIAVIALLATVGVVLAPSGAWAERRIALVIGNSNYTNADLRLTNPSSDATDVANALKGLGFEVVLATDATTREMDIALRNLTNLAGGADSVLFFYAGHAMQYNGRNYLMPVDARLEMESDLRRNMISDEDIRSALNRASGAKI